MALREKRMLEIEKGNTGWHSVENSLWKRLWACRKTDYGYTNTPRTTVFLDFVIV